MVQTIHESTVSKSSWFHYLVWLPLFLFFFIILLLNWNRVEVVWNPPYLFAALNIIFLTIIMLFVSVLAARSYLRKKSIIILFLGAGTLALGLGGLISGLVILGMSINSIVTIYNTSALISGFFILTSSIFGIKRFKVIRSGWLLLASYLGIVALISLLGFLVYNNFWPVYLIQGLGPTSIGLAVLYSTITLFTVSAFLLLIHSGRKGLTFRVWYGLGLGLIAVGLFGVSTQMGVGDPLNWVGRISQYLGAVYILIAVLLSIRETGSWMLPWEETLYEIEEKYHSLYNSMNEGVALHRISYDETGKAVDYIITDVNPAYEEIVSLKKEDVIDKKASEIYATRNPPNLDIYSTVAETGNPKTFEFYFEPLDRFFNVSVFTPKKGEFATIFEDITERIKAEEKLKESEARFRSVFQNSLDVIYRFNLQTSHYEYMSPAIRNLGFEPEEMMAMSNDEVLSRVHPEDLPDLLSILSQINQTGKGIAEYRFRGKDDTYKWWSNQMVVIKDSEGQPIYRDGSVRDITLKRQMEREIIRKQTEIQTLFDNTPAGMVLFDGKSPYTVLVHNKAYQEFFDETFRTQGMVGLNLYDYAPELETAGIVAVFDEVVKTKKAKNFLDFPYKSNPPHETWFNWYIAPIIVDDKVEALVSMSIDVTQQHIAEQALKTRSNELAKSNADLKQFAYIASHDLKEPLRMITTFLQLLKRRYEDQLDDDANEFIGFAVDGAKRLDNMIMDLLEYSRVTNKELEFTDVNTQEVLDNVIVNLRVLIDENDAQITQDPLPLIRGDKTHLMRIFQNLMENSLKYRREETPHIHISALKEVNQFVFSIKDNGIGIDSEHLEQIFTMFQRLHGHNEYEGTGIGLSITQRIVHQHGGEIWAESEPGKGSTFYFTVPR
jgi:PAS domain S-box-containing protein